MNGIIETFLLAMTPIGELRAAIPVALAVYKMPWTAAYIAAVLGNLVPAVFLLLFLEPVSAFLSRRFKIFKSFFGWLFARTRHRGGKWFKRYGWLGLIPFVAIPLPITGAWTGALLAYLFKIPFKKAFAAITAGVALAGAIVTTLTLTGITIEAYFGWPTLFAAIVISTVVIFILKFKIRHLKFN